MTSIDQRLWSVPSIGTSITNSNESSSDLESSSEGTDRFSTTQFNGQTELPTQEYARGETVDLLGSRLLDISTFSTGIAIESAFNQNTTLWFVRPYGSPIFTCAQEGDVAGMTRLLWNGDASVFDVDPYGLGLLYVRSLRLNVSIACYLHGSSTPATTAGEALEVQQPYKPPGG